MNKIQLDNKALKPEIRSFHLIKAICALGIIANHFSCYITNRAFLPLYTFANGSWGCVLVTIFFMVSGGLLYYNYSDKISVSTYYKKRWKAIFPMFYIAYFYFELGNMFTYKSFLFRGSLFPYVFTLLGMDGYLSGTVTTYYILGEWFLGAIILLYISFPLVLYFFKKNSEIVFAISLILYFVFLERPIINPQPFWSITSCFVSFVVGMIIIKYREFLTNRWSALVSLLCFTCLLLIEIPVSQDVCNHFTGLFLFVFLIFAGEKIMLNTVFNKIFTKIGKLSYAIFLLQHITIVKVLGAFNPSSPIKILILLFLTMLLIIVEALVLSLFTKYVLVKSEHIFCTIKSRFAKT